MGRDSVPALLAVAQGPASGLRQTAVRALGEIGHASAKVLACLRTCLGDTDLYVRARAAYALGALRSSDVESVLALRTALEDTDKIVRDGAIHALGEIGPPAQMALAALRSLRARDASAADRIDNAIDMIIGASRR
jgi:HEAT repeat protein